MIISYILVSLFFFVDYNSLIHDKIAVCVTFIITFLSILAALVQISGTSLKDLLTSDKGNNETEKIKFVSIDFDNVIEKLTEDFSGRKWLMNDLNKALEEKNSNVFLITGDPGAGKSAFLANLVKNDKRVKAYHFCISNDTETLKPGKFVLSLVKQLEDNLNDYMNYVQSLDNLKDIIKSDPLSRYRELISTPLDKLKEPEDPIIIVIDSLDEALTYGPKNIATILAGMRLPSWVYTVVSSRKKARITTMFSGYKAHEIEATSENNLTDVEDYLNLKLSDICDVLYQKEVNFKRLVSAIKEKGNGNFLYVKEVINAIKTDQLDPRSPETFPPGLEGLYFLNFQKSFPESADYQKFKSLISILLAAREPLNKEQLVRFTKKTTDDIDNQMSHLIEYFPKNEETGLYQIYHKSLGDWLDGTSVKGDRNYVVSIKEGHKNIADELLEQYKKGDRSLFTLEHLPLHLLECKQYKDLNDILTNFEFIEKKISEGKIYNLLEDYRRLNLDIISGPIILTAKNHNGIYDFLCPNCGKRNVISKKEIGKTINCRSCKKQKIKLNPFSILTE